MNVPAKSLLDPVGLLDDAINLLNAASMATAELDAYHRNALAIVLDHALAKIGIARADLAELGGIDEDPPGVS